MLRRQLCASGGPFGFRKDPAYRRKGGVKRRQNDLCIPRRMDYAVFTQRRSCHPKISHWHCQSSHTIFTTAGRRLYTSALRQLGGGRLCLSKSIFDKLSNANRVAGSALKELRDAARIICVPQAHKFHTNVT